MILKIIVTIVFSMDILALILGMNNIINLGTVLILVLMGHVSLCLGMLYDLKKWWNNFKIPLDNERY